VLERAVQFLQNFNDDSFDILLQAKDYFKFAVLFVAGVGLLFQIPVGVLAITRLGIVTPRQLAKNRGYVILGIAVLAAVATPTPDPFTMTIAMAPLIVLFELSILLARWLERVKPASTSSRWDDDDEPYDPFADEELDDADDDPPEAGEELDHDEGDDPPDAGEELDHDEGDDPPDADADASELEAAAERVAIASAEDEPADEVHDDDVDRTKLEGPDQKD
jgi:sec-independent protein translocase protein TatC